MHLARSHIMKSSNWLRGTARMVVASAFLFGAAVSLGACKSQPTQEFNPALLETLTFTADQVMVASTFHEEAREAFDIPADAVVIRGLPNMDGRYVFTPWSDGIVYVVFFEPPAEEREQFRSFQRNESGLAKSPVQKGRAVLIRSVESPTFGVDIQNTVAEFTVNDKAWLEHQGATIRVHSAIPLAFFEPHE